MSGGLLGPLETYEDLSGSMGTPRHLRGPLGTFWDVWGLQGPIGTYGDLGGPMGDNHDV